MAKVTETYAGQFRPHASSKGEGLKNTFDAFTGLLTQMPSNALGPSAEAIPPVAYFTHNPLHFMENMRPPPTMPSPSTQGAIRKINVPVASPATKHQPQTRLRGSLRRTRRYSLSSELKLRFLRVLGSGVQENHLDYHVDRPCGEHPPPSYCHATSNMAFVDYLSTAAS